MDNIAFDKDKDFHNNDLLNRNYKAVKTLPSVVTRCLAPCNVCTGEYIDVTYSFRMRCCCHCHSNINGADKI
jgi:hypothetical protein